MKPLLLIVSILLVVGTVVAFALRGVQGPSTDGAECTPDGGLHCTTDKINVCEGGKLRLAGGCAGGCIEEDGRARCFNAEGSLMAPVGTGCEPGMGMCGLDTGSLLVCRDGRLAHAAQCEKGCVDLGPGAALYCMDDAGGIRFAEGFGCPEFGGKAGLACDADGKGLLACQNGLLAPHTISCDVCVQMRTGSLTCLNAAGDRLNPLTGEIRPVVD